MNYRHIYHAGNIGDVLKHTVLIALIQAMTRKETPFAFLDTHAGIGVYNLHSIAAKKSLEARNGILSLLEASNPPPLIQTYLHCIESFNKDKTFFYPGSPAIANHFLRPQDRMILCELHKEDYETLKHFFHNNNQVAVHHLDAYQALKAFLPPKEKRGLVLIDPPYEKNEEYDCILQSLPKVLHHFRNGIYAIWYPIKLLRDAELFIKKLRAEINLPTLNIELCAYPPDTPSQLNGSGIFLINPPYKIEETLKSFLPWLAQQIGNGNFEHWRIKA